LDADGGCDSAVMASQICGKFRPVPKGWFTRKMAIKTVSVCVQESINDSVSVDLGT